MLDVFRDGAQEAADYLSFSGEIDLAEKSSVEAQLHPLMQKKSRAVIIDLAGVSYMDSSGLALFVDAFQPMQCYGGLIALAGVRENVRELFQIVRLDQIFPIYPDRTLRRWAK